MKKTIKKKWSAQDQGGIQFLRRRYVDYQEYLRHQKMKLDWLLVGKPDWIFNYDKKYFLTLKTRLSGLGLPLKNKKTICLGARIGTEVKAFLNLSSFAVGIDLNPGRNNKHVLFGDFHHIQFPDGSAEIVFINCLDHVYDARTVANEIERVLSPGGLLIVEAVHGSDKLEKMGFFESFWWSSTQDIVNLFERSNFRLDKRFAITDPWPGEFLSFTKI